MTQGYNQLNLFNRNLPMVITGGGAPSRISGVQYQEIPELITRKHFDIGEGKQIGYKLPDGTYTSNPELVNIAKQQVAKANRKAFLRAAGKGVGIVPTAVEFYKNLAFPVANDLYQGFIMGNPDKSKTLQAALKLAGLDRNGNRVVRERPNNANDTGVPFEILDDNQLAGGKSVQANNKRGQTGGRPTTKAQVLALAQQLGSNPPKANQQEADAQQADISAINDYISKLQEINQPYIESLQKFVDNYSDLYNQNQLASRRLRDVSAITGNPIWYQSARDYNPLEVEATKIDLQKKIQDAQASDLNAINEIMGNLAMAEEMGLPPEAAFANKNLLTMMAARDREANRYQIALENNLMKKYGIDRNYARALTVQAMRNQGAMDRAILNAQTYGMGGYQPAPGLNARGQAATSQDLTMEQILQQAAKQNK